MATITKNIRGTGDLLPGLKKFLEYRSIPYRQLNIEGSHIGYTNDQAVFVTKKQIWRGQVSTQRYLVEKSIEKERWIIFYIPKVGVFKFDPKKLFDNSWQNFRGKEKMLNVCIEHGEKVTNPEELRNLKPLQYNISEQLQFA